jgi:membrane fusion protein
VDSVSHAALSDDELRQWQVGKTSAAPAGSYYCVTVRPDRQAVTTSAGAAPIPANMQVEADVLLDSRPLYQWILEPLYTIGRAWRSR